MTKTGYLAALCLTWLVQPALAAGNPDQGRDLVMRSCVACHAPASAATASDSAPPLSFIAKDNKRNPAWVHGWLMDPHPPMPGIMLSRRQIDDIVAYLDTLGETAPSK